MVRQRSAKPLFTGSIPVLASRIDLKGALVGRPDFDKVYIKSGQPLTFQVFVIVEQL